MPTPWSLQAPALPSADLSLVVGSSWGTTAAGNGRFPIYDRCSTNTAACFPVLVGGIDPFRLVLFEFADQNWGVSSCPSVLQLFARYWEPQFVDDDFQHQTSYHFCMSCLKIGYPKKTLKNIFRSSSSLLKLPEKSVQTPHVATTRASGQGYQALNNGSSPPETMRKSRGWNHILGAIHFLCAQYDRGMGIMGFECWLPWGI